MVVLASRLVPATRLSLPALALVLSAAGCASAPPPAYESAPVRAVEQRPPLPAPDSGTESVEFKKFVVRVPADHVIGAVQAGPDCRGTGPLTWKIGRDGSVGDDFGQLLVEQLASAGYKVAGSEESLFEDPHEKRAEFAIAGVVRDVRANVCYAKPRWLSATAGASLAVDWQVYSRLTKTVEWKGTTEGSSAVGTAQEGAGAEAISRAFVSAARNLLADPDLRELLAGMARAPSSAPPPPILVAYDTQAGSGRRKVESVVSDARMGVVTVLATDGMGSGFVISPDGYLLTDQHVVGDSRYVRVKFVTGREANGEVVRSDRRRDVALVKLENDIYPHLPLGESSRVEPGADVFAIGTPLAENFGQTVTKGIVSGYGEEDGLRILRSDVSVHKGNSGGPLLDGSGVVVGLSVSGYMLMPEGVGVGLNAFIPIEEALSALAIQRRAK